jgi:hypothetical protein
MLHDQSKKSLQRCAQGSKTRQHVVHVCTMQLHTRCPIAHSTHSSLPAPRDRLLTLLVTCANRADGEDKKTIDVEQRSSWEDEIVREDWLPLIYARKSSLAFATVVVNWVWLAFGHTLQLLCLGETR